MIESFNVDEKNVSRWAGIASAAFSLSQAVTGVFWGRLADKIGRKPAVLSGLFCTMACVLLWGFSRSLPWAIVARSLAGASNGNVGTMRTIVAEMVPQRELQPRAFSIMPLVWTIGTIFGPALGGALAKPASRYPKLFGQSHLLRQFPFVLPNIVASILTLAGLSIGFLFLHETLAAKRNRKDYGVMLGQKLLGPINSRFSKTSLPEDQRPLLKGSRTSSSSSTQIRDPMQDSRPAPAKPPTYREVFTYQSNLNLLVYALLAMHSIGYDQLLPIFMHYPRQTDRSTNPNVTLPLKFTGGFGINSDRIGLILVAYGIVGMFIQFFVFPPLVRRWGVLNSLKSVVVIFPAVYVLTPFAALLPSPRLQQIGIFIIMLFKCWAVIFAFPCSTILLTNSASSLRILGTLNGVAVSVSALGRAAGPAIGGWTFTIGANTGYGILPWWTLAGVAVLAAVPVWWLVETEGIGRDDAPDEEDGLPQIDVEASQERGEPLVDETALTTENVFQEGEPLTAQLSSKKG